jgi:hypothetical protein
MPTYPKNRIVQQVAPISLFEDASALISSAVSWNQGDLLYLDTVANLLKPVGSDANAATICGIARQTIISGKLAPVYQGTQVDAAVAIEAVAGPQAGVVAKLKLKSGDAFVPGQAVYYGGDAQTVSSVGSPTNVNVVGIYQDAGVTAGATSEGNIMLVQYRAGL